MAFSREKVPSGWSLFVHEVCSEVSRTAFLASVQWCDKRLQPVIERYIDDITIMSHQTCYFHHIQSFKICNVYIEISYDKGVCVITNGPRPSTS